MLVAEAIVRSIHYVSTVGLAALCACPAILQVRRQLGFAQLERILAAIAAASWCVLLLFTLLVWNEGNWESLTDPTTWQTLVATSFGRIWCARFILLLACVILSIHPTGRLSSVQIGLAELACVSIAATGHAAADPRWVGPLHLGNDALHLFSATFWPGGLLLLFQLLRPGRLSSLELPRVISRFSTMSLIAAGVLVATGICNALLTVEHWDLRESYLRTLAIKVALVVMLLFVGSINLLQRRPALARAPSDSERDRLRAAIRNLVSWECALALMVFVATGFLTLSPP
ncbi:MAG: CopD family protein [Verrucomicrobia bacterium]|nr:CopD family protein [Verrucomicrobiota bacterium]